MVVSKPCVHPHCPPRQGIIRGQYESVELIREVVRPGVLYFLPDPKDHRYRPIQDIVEQPTLLLIKRMCRIAVAYFMLILVGMGIVAIIVGKYGGIYPIVWKFGLVDLSMGLLCITQYN